MEHSRLEQVPICIASTVGCNLPSDVTGPTPHFRLKKKVIKRAGGLAFGAAIKMLLGKPKSHIRVPGFIFSLHSFFQLADNAHLRRQ